MKIKQPKPKHRCRVLASTVVAAQLIISVATASAQSAAHVIHISIDGLRPDAITALGPTNLPNFYRLRNEGAFTDNARTDYDYTVTLPNHTCQLTGRGVVGATGHGWTSNGDPAAGQTLASNKGSYIAGAFDVAHDAGLRTGLYASKTKFSLYNTSWNAANGALDLTGADNGRDKIDLYLYNASSLTLVNTLVANMATQALHYAFLHFAEPDNTGHSSGWVITPGSAYSNVIKTMDSRLGVIFALIATNAQLAGRTAIVLTTDHGGLGTDHSNATLREVYTIPFYVWGPGVMAGASLYALNPANRSNPGTTRPAYTAPVQPIRNGESGNLALKLLGLPPVPGSTINHAQDLAVTVASPSDFQLTLVGDSGVLTFSTKTNVLYDVQALDDWATGTWVNLATNIVGTGGVVTNVDAAAAGLAQRFYWLRLHF